MTRILAALATGIAIGVAIGLLPGPRKAFPEAVYRGKRGDDAWLDDLLADVRYRMERDPIGPYTISGRHIAPEDDWSTDGYTAGLVR